MTIKPVDTQVLLLAIELNRWQIVWLGWLDLGVEFEDARFCQSRGGSNKQTSGARELRGQRQASDLRTQWWWHRQLVFRLGEELCRRGSAGAKAATCDLVRS